MPSFSPTENAAITSPGACTTSELKLAAANVIVPDTGCPVVFASSTCTSACFAAMSGYTCRSATYTFGLAANVMAPAIPFQFPWVLSETLCAFSPTSIFTVLSTRSVTRCFPGVISADTSYWCGVERPFCMPIYCPSNQSCVSQWGRSSERVICFPTNLSGTSTSR